MLALVDVGGSAGGGANAGEIGSWVGTGLDDGGTAGGAGADEVEGALCRKKVNFWIMSRMRWRKRTSKVFLGAAWGKRDQDLALGLRDLGSWHGGCQSGDGDGGEEGELHFCG